MPPFRPSNLNKRAYPGNASVIGPTCTATLGITTTSCCSSTSTCSACSVQNVLGCRCTFCACPSCNICCSCPCTVCARTIPSGRWKASEQYEARTRDAWGDTNCVTGAPTCLCCTNVGVSCTGVTAITDCKGFFICCGPTTNKWFVSPFCTELQRSWGSNGDSAVCACILLGDCGWFSPTASQYVNPGFCCRTYWDSYSASTYWSSNGGPNRHAVKVSMVNGQGFNPHYQPEINCVRAFRCVAS